MTAREYAAVHATTGAAGPTTGRASGEGALVSDVWPGFEQLTPRQRDVQSAHHTGFWEGFRRGIILGNIVGLPPFLIWLVWWWVR